MSRKIHTDVLVIGGGAAGARAALEADAAGLSVVMAVKGLLGRSGCSIFAGNLDWMDSENSVDDAERIRRLMEFYGKYTHYLGDQAYLYDATEYLIHDFFPWLEERGLIVLRHDDGTVVTDLPANTQTWSVSQGLSGQVVMRLLRDLIAQQPITLLEQTSVIDLLQADGRVLGALAIDYRTGELVTISATSTILATGHNNYLAKRSTGTREGAANGWALGYRAGVALQDIEMQWFHASDIAAPVSWMRLHLYPNPMPDMEERTRLFNADGELFFASEADAEQSVPYIMQMKALIDQTRQGKAQLDRGYYTSYRHVDQEKLRKYVAPIAFLDKLKLDPATDLIENGATWHMNVGGLQVDGATMESGRPGLFIAGSVSALVTGGLPNVMYDGIKAAQSAAAYCGQTDASAPDPAQIASAQVRVEAARRATGGRYVPAQVKAMIRDIMWRHCGPIKDESTMQAGRAELAGVREHVVPEMALQSPHRRFCFDVVEALDVQDMLDVCDLIFQFSLFRTESRGAFFREDHPITDNDEWLVHTVGRRAGDGTLALGVEPVAMPYVQPAEHGRNDYFALDY